MKKWILTAFSFIIWNSVFATEKEEDHHVKILTGVGVSEREGQDPDFLARIIYLPEEMPTPRATDNDFGNIGNHGYIQPEFVEAVLQSPGLEVLEVGPGDGLVLQQILTNARNQSNPIRYTMVEPCHSHLKNIDKVINSHNKNGKNWFGKAKNGDIRQFIVGKEKRYDLILCSQVLHFFDPLDQLNVLIGLRNALKDNGRLYLIINSLLSLNLWVPGANEDSIREQSKAYIREIKQNQKKNDLWPGYLLNTTYMTQRLGIKKMEGIDYDAPTLHGPSTLKPLLDAVGFKVNECQNFTEMTKGSQYAASVRLGTIATREGEMNAQLIEQYTEQAQSKRQKRQEIEGIIDENFPIVLQLLSPMNL